MDGRPENVKALRNKELPKCRRDGCKLHVTVNRTGEFHSSRGYCTLICLNKDYETNGADAIHTSRFVRAGMRRIAPDAR